MKTFFTSMFLLGMIVFILIPGQSFAQSGTMTVYASGQTLDQIIAGDQTNGVQNHSVYKLVSLDSTYLVDATITISSSVSIIGVPDPTTGKLPSIQSDVLQSTQVTGIQFTFNGPKSTVILKNLYLLGVAPNNAVSTQSGQGVQVSADSISLIVDNCVFDDFTQFDIGYNANWDKFKITNSKFRNGVEGDAQYYIPEVLRNEYPGTAPTDTVIMNYNTMLCVASGPVLASSFVKYFEFIHNDVVDAAKAPVWIERATDAKIDNNIFYNTYAVAEAYFEYKGFWDEKGTQLRIPAVINFVPLDSATTANFIGKASSNSADSAAAEAARKIEVKNNAYFWSSDLLNFYTTWNDTATAAYDSLVTPVFMNSGTAVMFGNSAYPNFVQSGNQNVDPKFGSGIANVDGNSTTGDGNGLLDWIAAIRGGTATTQYYAYQRTDGTALAPPWPLPEYTSNDLKYSATLTSTDSKQVGDPYWFTGTPTGVKQVPAQGPAKFALSNNYPNPFNPSTTINFSLAKDGNVTLNIYNVMGQLVKSVVSNAYMSKGEHNYIVNMDNFASGVYFYALRQGSNIITKKMVLLK